MPDNVSEKSKWSVPAKYRPLVYSLLGGSALMLFWAYMNQSEQAFLAGLAPTAGQTPQSSDGAVGPTANGPLPYRAGHDDGYETEDEGEDGYGTAGGTGATGGGPLAPPASGSTAAVSTTSYKDGTYRASNDAPWGPMTIDVTVKNGKWADIKAVQIPDSPPSYSAVPQLIQQALAAQSDAIDGVSGATYTSVSFRDDLTRIMALAKK